MPFVRGMNPHEHTPTHQTRRRNYGWKLWGPLGTGRRYIRWDQPHGNVSQRIIFRSPTGAHYQTGRTKKTETRQGFIIDLRGADAHVCVFVLKGLILVVFFPAPSLFAELGGKGVAGSIPFGRLPDSASFRAPAWRFRFI